MDIPFAMMRFLVYFAIRMRYVRYAERIACPFEASTSLAGVVVSKDERQMTKLERVESCR